ncbi:FAD-binding protein [Tunturiibacter gelidiferens]|uniref:FAD-binding protein n=1 Tax=Tunturiibacter gelidiferens TaxID=3069689 RepID=UPI003D9AB634
MPSSKLDVQENVPLAPYTTLRIGGPARFFCEVTTETELLEAVLFARERNLPLFVLGGGSNLLVGESGFGGLVLHMAIATPMLASAVGDSSKSQPPPAPTGTPSSSNSASRESAASSASPASPAPSAVPPSRT